jgi:hypothetical protein
MVAEWGDYIRGETLADAIDFSMSPGVETKSVNVGESVVNIWIVMNS